MNPNSAPEITIVCALKEEFAAVAAGLGSDYQQRFELIRAGVGPDAAARVAKELAARAVPPKWIVSSGFCGGLLETVLVGDIIVANGIVDAESGDYCSCGNSVPIYMELKRPGHRTHGSRIVCTREAVFSTAAKRALCERFAAIAVDMESRALADNVDLSKTQVIVVRAVSDAVTDELPSEVGDFLNEKGNVRIGKITRFIFKEMGNMKRLMELKKRSDVASASLTKAWRAIKDLKF